ncbi:MAG: prepilin-type N-terminal cleavage/methylation domain-containing protein [Phycisphaerae bacterium]
MNGQETGTGNPRGNGRRVGFTLIELLVVVSIIALLISILLPSLKSAREQARQVKCMAHLRGLGTAGFTFSQEHNNRFQLTADPGAVGRTDPDKKRFAYDEQGEILAWPVALADASGLKDYRSNHRWGVRADDWKTADQRKEFMSDDFQLAVCPSDRVRLATPFYPTGTSLLPIPPRFSDRPQGSRYWGLLSYGINEDVTGAEDNNGNPKSYDCWRNGWFGQISPENKAGERLEGNLDRVFDPSTVLLMVDAGPNTVSEARRGNFNVMDGYANLVMSAQTPGPYLGDNRVKWPLRVPDKRHPKGKLSVAFCDFHAETVKPVPGKVYRRLGFPDVPSQYTPRVRVSPYRYYVEPGSPTDQIGGS